MGKVTPGYLYSAFYKGHKIVLTGDSNFELLIDGVEHDKKSSNYFLLNSEATFNGSLKLENGENSEVVLEYSTFWCMYSVVMLYIDGVLVDGVKAGIFALGSMNNRHI